MPQEPSVQDPAGVELDQRRRAAAPRPAGTVAGWQVLAFVLAVLGAAGGVVAVALPWLDDRPLKRDPVTTLALPDSVMGLPRVVGDAEADAVTGDAQSDSDVALLADVAESDGAAYGDLTSGPAVVVQTWLFGSSLSSTRQRELTQLFWMSLGVQPEQLAPGSLGGVLECARVTRGGRTGWACVSMDAHATLSIIRLDRGATGTGYDERQVRQIRETVEHRS